MSENEFEKFLERAEQGLEDINTVLSEFKKYAVENSKLRKDRGFKPTSFVEMSDIDSCLYRHYRCGLCDSRISEGDRYCRMCGKKIIW